MKLPETVYLVSRTPPPTEKKKYYGPVRKVRIYRTMAHARTFINANKSSDFEVYEGVVSWKKVELDD